MQKQHIKLTSEAEQYLAPLLARGTMKVQVSKRALALLELDYRQDLTGCSR